MLRSTRRLTYRITVKDVCTKVTPGPDGQPASRTPPETQPAASANSRASIYITRQGYFDRRFPAIQGGGDFNPGSEHFKGRFLSSRTVSGYWHRTSSVGDEGFTTDCDAGRIRFTARRRPAS